MGEGVTRDEALAVARIFDTADGNCSQCAGRLYKKAARKWPEHVDVFTYDTPENEALRKAAAAYAEANKCENCFDGEKVVGSDYCDECSWMNELAKPG